MYNLRDFSDAEKKQMKQEDKKLEMITIMYNRYTYSEIELVLRELHLNKIIENSIRTENEAPPTPEKITEWKKKTQTYKKQAKKTAVKK